MNERPKSKRNLHLMAAPRRKGDSEIACQTGTSIVNPAKRTNSNLMPLITEFSIRK